MTIRARALSIGLVAALAASGCGAEESAKKAAGSAKNALDPVAQAAETTSSQKGGIAVTLKGGASVAGQDVPMEGSGVQDRAGKKGKFSFTTQVGGKSMKIDEVMVDQVIYMRSDLFSQLPGGKPWMKLDLRAAAAKQGIDLDALGNGATQDPTAALDYLKGAGTSKKVGTATINGTKTTQYHVDVDLRKAASKNSDPDAKKSVEKLIQTSGVQTLPVDVWVDDQHLVRREKVAYSADIKGEKTSFDFTIDLTKFGVDVDVKAPPADQVSDISDLLSQAGAVSGGASS
ncbi:MAG TPA: hypothetical protein VFG42_27295 [Baekduia sp.]|uniref:hypothetical protein n=1 Tax=Baekduia sp. TaxID=2600305 RepID=UPI002D774870|nr:hypothetical protein [Baekduia sp.]HET6510532.1 hypothetical protein [Baekduia sp.]